MAQSLVQDTLIAQTTCPVCDQYFLPPVKQCGYCDLPVCSECVKPEQFCPCCESHFDGIPCLELNTILEDLSLPCKRCPFVGKASNMREHLRQSCPAKDEPSPVGDNPVMSAHRAMCASMTSCPLRFHSTGCLWIGSDNDDLLLHVMEAHEDNMIIGCETISDRAIVYADLEEEKDNWALYPSIKGQLLMQVAINRTDESVTIRCMVHDKSGQDRPKVKLDFYNFDTEEDVPEFSIVKSCMLDRQFNLDDCVRLTFAQATALSLEGELCFAFSVLDN